MWEIVWINSSQVVGEKNQNIPKKLIHPREQKMYLHQQCERITFSVNKRKEFLCVIHGILLTKLTI